MASTPGTSCLKMAIRARPSVSKQKPFAAASRLTLDQTSWEVLRRPDKLGGAADHVPFYLISHELGMLQLLMVLLAQLRPCHYQHLAEGQADLWRLGNIGADQGDPAVSDQSRVVRPEQESRGACVGVAHLGEGVAAEDDAGVGTGTDLDRQSLKEPVNLR